MSIKEYLRSRTFKNAMSNLEGKQIPIEAVNYLKTLSRHPLLIEASLVTKRRNEQKKHDKLGRTSQSTIKSHFDHDGDVDDLVDGISSLVS